jgi:hypothetical protein
MLHRSLFTSRGSTRPPRRTGTLIIARTARLEGPNAARNAEHRRIPLGQLPQQRGRMEVPAKRLVVLRLGLADEEEEWNLHGSPMGQNIYEARRRGAIAVRRTGVACVFVSYTRADRIAARSIVRYLEDVIDAETYFDQDDPDLTLAATAGDNEGIVSYLENGIKESTHLLGVISEATRDSWFVPFEIGSARRLERPIAYVQLADVSDLPAYLRIATLIDSEAKLATWSRILPGIRVERATYWRVPKIPGLPDFSLGSPRFRRTP